MTYIEFINNIINTRGLWGIPDDEIFELHHIVPKCLGGLPKKVHNHLIKHENLIRLYPNEHFKAHQLLAQENPQNKYLTYAFWCLAHYTNHKINLDITANDYEEARINFIKARNNTKQSLEANSKRAQTLKNKHLHWYHKNDLEVRAPECPDGFMPGRSQKSKQQVSIKNKQRDLHLFGEANGMYNKKHSQETKNKIALFGKNRHWYNNGIKEVFELSCPEGFEKGRLSGQNKLKTGTKIWVFKDNKSKMILKEDLEEYLAAGWKRGRHI